jgi:cytochrome c oxidase subunit 3
MQKNSLNFELSLWYWHFVDIVWLFVYLVLYWWGINF